MAKPKGGGRRGNLGSPTKLMFFFPTGLEALVPAKKLSSKQQSCLPLLQTPISMRLSVG